MNELQTWFQTALGQAVASQECRVLARWLTGTYARRVLQVGAFGNGERPPLFRDARQWVLDQDCSGAVDIHADAEELPFETASMDAVLLIHQLEFARHPHQVLREATRIVAPEGYLILTGFNPMSLWGVRRLIAGPGERPAPWRGRFYGATRLQDWLALLGLSVEWRGGLMLRPPLNNAAVLERLAGLERHAPTVGRWFGGVRLYGARKRVRGVVPTVPAARPRLAVIPGGAPQPASSVASRPRTGLAIVGREPRSRKPNHQEHCNEQ